MASNLAWGQGARLAPKWTTGFGIIAYDLYDDGKLGWKSGVAAGFLIRDTAFILRPGWSTSTYGTIVRHAAQYTGVLVRAGARLGLTVVTNPYVLAVAVPVVAGGIISVAIDPEDGLNNFSGFITGGLVGEDTPNYWDTDANDSGYFNIPKNFETVAESQPLTRALTWTISETNKKVNWWESFVSENMPSF